MRFLSLLLLGCALAAAVYLSRQNHPERAATDRTVAGAEPAEEAAPSRPVSLDSFRIATLNAAFLFDGEEPEGSADFPHRGDPGAAREHLNGVGALIRSLRADVIVLQEIENERVLELLVEGPLAGLGYRPHFVQGKDTATGQDVGLLARVPVSETGRTDERAPVAGSGDDYGVSKNLYARLDVGGQPLTVIGLHFLSQPDNKRRKPQREAQAEVIRRLVAAEASAGRAVAVLGDFNDFDGATPDAEGNRPISDVLARIQSAGEGPGDDLRSVLAEVPQPERYTHFYDRNDNGRMEPGERSALDHILLSPRLFDRVIDVEYVHTYDPGRYTDHFPIVVTLNLN